MTAWFGAGPIVHPEHLQPLQHFTSSCISSVCQLSAIACSVYERAGIKIVHSHGRCERGPGLARPFGYVPVAAAMRSGEKGSSKEPSFA
jgi:hypothetical protein